MPIKILKASNKAKKAPETSPYVPIVDKISIPLNLPPHDFGDIQKAVYQGIEDNAVFQPTKKSARYHVVQLIAIEGTAERVHFMFDGKFPNLPDARIQFNPSKLGPSGMKGLHKVLGKIFPGGWSYFTEHGRVSGIDIAIDFPGVRMHHFNLLPDKVLTTKTYAEQAKLKTIYSGKPTGNQLKLYSKSYQLWLKGKKKGEKGPPVVRVEKRLRNLKKPLKDLASLGNPLLGFTLVAHPAGPPADESQKLKWVWPVLLDSVATRGLGPALKLLPANRMAMYRKHFAEHAQEWWKPGAIWAKWPEALKKANLLP